MTKRLSAFILVFLTLATSLMACWEEHDMPKGLLYNNDYLIVQVNDQSCSNWNSLSNSDKKTHYGLTTGLYTFNDVYAKPPFKIFVASPKDNLQYQFDSSEILGNDIPINTYAIFYMVRRNGTTITEWTRVKFCEYEVSQALTNDLNRVYPVSIIGDTLVSPRGLQNGDEVYVIFPYDDVSGSMEGIQSVNFDDVTAVIEEDGISSLDIHVRALVVRIVVTNN